MGLEAWRPGGKDKYASLFRTTKLEWTVGGSWIITSQDAYTVWNLPISLKKSVSEALKERMRRKILFMEAHEQHSPVTLGKG